MGTKNCTISGKVSAAEQALIRAYAAERGCEVSELTRELWLAELRDKKLLSVAVTERAASVEMLELFKLTMRMSFGDSEEGRRFTEFCRQVAAKSEWKE